MKYLVLQPCGLVRLLLNTDESLNIIYELLVWYYRTSLEQLYKLIIELKVIEVGNLNGNRGNDIQNDMFFGCI